MTPTYGYDTKYEKSLGTGQKIKAKITSTSLATRILTATITMPTRTITIAELSEAIMATVIGNERDET